MMTQDCDVIVVGSGAGGATLAYACARAGKSVLLLERGRKYHLDSPVHDERAMLIDKRPYYDRQVEVNGTPKRLYVGGVFGGGTALYGAALLRPSQDDFHPGKHYGARIPRAIWDWPIEYEALEPYYAEAERLFGVAGTADDDFGPLEKPRSYPQRPLPIHPINQRLMAANRADGLRPFQLPLAIDPNRCLRCHACAGYICPTGARSSSGQLLEQAVSQGLPLHILTNAEVESFSWQADGSAGGVCVRDRDSGVRTIRRARRYVLAAGAIGSALLLLRSGVSEPLVGRHYMFHLSPIVIGVFPRRTGADETFVKQIGFTDYYFGTKQYAQKMGLVQSLPVPGPLLAAKMAPRLVPRQFIHFLRQRMLPLAGIVEDLPNPANRVTCGPQGEPRLHHRFDSYDSERGERLSRRMARILRKAGAVMCLTTPFPSDEHVAHQCGTLRFGTHADHAVLDPDCRMFKHPNVFVVDGSFMPTSLGVGPALTIAANALRVADVVSHSV
jgi:choline dehydrogenase-like flavoprotein